jgi:hypothetical protein
MNCESCYDVCESATEFFFDTAFNNVPPSEFVATCKECDKVHTFTRCVGCDGNGETMEYCGDGCCSWGVTCKYCNKHGFESDSFDF